MHHFVMGKGEDKILGKAVEQPKGQQVMVIVPMDRVLAEIG